MFDYHVALWALDSTSISKHHTFCVNYSNIYWHHSKWHYKAYLRGNCRLVTQWNISILWRSCPRLGQELAIYFDDLRSVYPPPKKLGIDKEVKGHLFFVSRVDQLIFRKSNRGVLKIYEVQYLNLLFGWCLISRLFGCFCFARKAVTSNCIGDNFSLRLNCHGSGDGASAGSLLLNILFHLRRRNSKATTRNMTISYNTFVWCFMVSPRVSQLVSPIAFTMSGRNFCQPLPRSLTVRPWKVKGSQKERIVFQLSPIASMGLVYLPTWMVDFYGFHVGKYTIYHKKSTKCRDKYTSPMDSAYGDHFFQGQKNVKTSGLCFSTDPRNENDTRKDLIEVFHRFGTQIRLHREQAGPNKKNPRTPRWDSFFFWKGKS